MSWNGKKGDNITIQVGTVNDLIFNAGCSGGGFLITNPWGTTDITDSTTTTTTTDDTTDKSGGDGIKLLAESAILSILIIFVF